MIPKIDFYRPRITGFSSGSWFAPDSSGIRNFQEILLETQKEDRPLEGFALNFLIETIEYIMETFIQEQRNAHPTTMGISLKARGSTFLSYPPEPSSDPESVSIDLRKGREFDDFIQEAAERYQVDPALIKAVISVESNGNPKAVSPAGAMGLMQLMPKTAAELGVKDPFDPRENILAGTRYLSRLLERYQGNRFLALAAYNWGMGNLEKNPQNLPRETRNYLVRVEQRLKANLNLSPSV